MLRRLSLLLGLAAMVGCSSPTVPDEAPFVSGEITARDSTGRFLVEAPGFPGGESSAWVRVDRRTDVLLEGGGEAGRDRLDVGTFVSVWTSGPIATSDPPQVYARTVLVHRIQTR